MPICDDRSTGRAPSSARGPASPHFGRCARHRTRRERSTSPGSSRSRRGRRRSGSSGCARCSPRSGEPQRAFPAIHVVGTNGKSLDHADVRRAAPRRRAERRRVRLAARARLGRADPGRRRARRPRARARARPAARGRRDAVRGAHRRRAAPSSPRARSTWPSSRRGSAVATTRRTCSTRAVVVLTNVALDHTDVLGSTREAIAAEKLAVITPGAVVVLGEPEWAADARARGASRVDVLSGSNLGLAVAAAEAYLGEPVDPGAGRGGPDPRHGSSAGASIRSSSGTARTTSRGSGTCSAASRAGASRSSRRSSPTRTSTRCCARSRPSATRFVATRSSNARALPAAELAARAAPYFAGRRGRRRPARRARDGARARRRGRRDPRDGLALPPCRAFVVRIETVR